MTNSNIIQAYTSNTTYIGSTDWETLIILPNNNTFKNILQEVSYYLINEGIRKQGDLQWITPEEIILPNPYQDSIEFIINNNNEIQFRCPENYQIAGFMIKVNYSGNLKLSDFTAEIKIKDGLFILVIMLFKHIQQEITLVLLILHSSAFS